ncbi:aminoglycoside N(3)-acetyltransferase [Micromonospora mirobrigensis]|uniref:Aminoglycoside N(3)-acetyltransferase n=1 Tax=Micromonospora mirobrigensis TaxID=262898 RepID=A0A1C5A3R0_9ACTN|nr:AAC(3) family N-acetyltransferase [Micromonospora mirobrigensis]SCF39789.1 aminoglycoside 3-N-acetyltransferase [Micromonospora mirobrigensis]
MLPATDPSTVAAHRARLAADLRALGLRPGQDVLVHCSLRRLGRPPGGPATLAAALWDVLGPAGTLLVPTENAGNSTTSRAYRAAVAGLDFRQLAAYHAAMPGWDRATTPSEGTGAFAEHVRLTPGAVRSDHPQTSFTALGSRAHRFTDGHELECHLGERSPLARLYDADGLVLLLGVGWAACTALHLAEYRLPVPPPSRRYHCYRQVDGERVPLEFTGLDLDDTDFPALGAALDATPVVRHGRVGDTTARLLPVRATVDLAVVWFTANRPGARR